jgi:phosphodiesterase/alkaline phosphatase D-like protein
VSSREIQVTWSDVAYESSYRVERSATGTSGWTTVGTVGADTLTFNNPGLTPSTKYYYRVIAVNSTGESPASAVVNATTPATPTAVPSAPSSPALTVLSSTSIKMTWRDTTNELYFRVERSLSSTGGWTQVATVPTNTLLFTDTGLTPSTTYYYRVFAVNELGSSASSSVVSKTTQAPPPAAPSNLRSTSVGRTSVGLAWNDNATNESGFKVEQSTNGTTWTQLGTTSANVTTYTYSKLSANTSYYYRVRAYNSVNASDYSNVLSIKTLP